MSTDKLHIPISGARASDIGRAIQMLDRHADTYMTSVSLVMSQIKENLPLNDRVAELVKAHAFWRAALLDIHADLVRDIEAIGDRL